MARGSGGSSPLPRLGAGSFQGVSGAQTRRRAAAAPPEVCGHLQLRLAAVARAKAAVQFGSKIRTI
jgi:hypothetical protein